MEMRGNCILHNAFHLMQATHFQLGPACSEIVSHILNDPAGILERFFETAAAETDTPPRCGAGFSHWYHMALQL